MEPNETKRSLIELFVLGGIKFFFVLLIVLWIAGVVWDICGWWVLVPILAVYLIRIRLDILERRIIR